MRDYTKYEVWIDAIRIAKEVYQLTTKFPDSEKFGLISQMRRASISISSNIAEGCSRSTDKDFKRFIEISIGSLFVLNSQLHLSVELGMLDNIIYLKIKEVITKNLKQLNSLRNKLKS